MQQVHDDFGVGIRDEYVTHLLELSPQRLVVLDDAVVHHGQIITGEMRMGIALAGRAMGCPAGMRNA